jgi:hypothetical protein
VGIELENASGAQVYNNTVYQEHGYPAAISVRFGGSDAYVANNLLRTAASGKVIWKRDGPSVTQEANVVTAQASWFVDVSSGDLRLASAVPNVVDQAVAVSGLTEDFDGRSRPVGAGPDIGAFEYPVGGGLGVLLPRSWGSVKALYR